MKIYLISGLGADHRAFEKLSFPSGYEVVHLPWIDAFPNEKLEDYAKRMSERILLDEPFVLGGLSFGGIVAIEIAKWLKPVKLILFSTVTLRRDLPWFYRFAGHLKLYRIFPERTFNPFLPFLFWFFGPLDETGRDLLRYFASLNKPYTLGWALEQISTWKNTRSLPDVIHIHGDLDKAFPGNYFYTFDSIVKGAGHLAVYTHAEEVSLAIHKFL